MQFSEKGFPYSSRSLPTKPNSPGKDENRNQNCRIESRIETLSRGKTKRFMAQTVSAASKAVTPSRKKPLAERNWESASGFSFPDTQNQGSPNLDLNFSSKKSGVCDSSVVSSPVSPLSLTPAGVLGCGDGNGRRDLTPELSNRPYDQLTNYLSPRPKFLRYNPNRRREMFYVEECGNGEGKDGSESESTVTCSDSMKGVDNEGSSVSGAGSSSHDSPSLEGWLDQENGGNKSSEVVVDGRDHSHDEIEEEGEELEEGDEERSQCGLKGLLKLFLVLIVLVLSSAYISSMNSPTPPPPLEYIRRLKVQDITSKAASLKGFKGESALQLISGMKDFNVSVRNFEGESWLPSMKGLKDECLKIAGKVRKVVPVKVFDEESEHLNDADESKMDAFDDATGHSAEGDGDVTLVGIDTEKDEVEGASEEGVEGGVTSEENLANTELQAVQISETFESIEDYYAMRLFDMMRNLPSLYSAKAHGAEEVTDSQLLVNHSVDEVADKTEISGHNVSEVVSVHQEDEVNRLEEQKVVETSIEVREIDELHVGVQKAQPSIETTQKSEELASEADGLVEFHAEQVVEFLSDRRTLLCAAAVCCGVLVSLVARLCSKFKKAAPETNVLNSKPCSKAGTPKNSSRAGLLSTKTETMRETDYVDSLIHPVSNIHLEEDIVVMKEAPVRIRAPKVELLGEVVFGEVSNQLKNCSMRSVMTNGVEESSFSISDLRTAKGHREHTTSSHLQVSPFEVSATSHRSFTVEEKETGGSGSKMSTPVRRSSRIHNRGVTSSR